MEKSKTVLMTGERRDMQGTGRSREVKEVNTVLYRRRTQLLCSLPLNLYSGEMPHADHVASYHYLSSDPWVFEIK